VIDGDTMLQLLPWPKSASYADLIQLYIQYNHFTNVLVVFDGYVNGPSTKDETSEERR